MIESLVDIAKYLLPLALVISGMAIVLGIYMIRCFVLSKDDLFKKYTSVGYSTWFVVFIILVIPYINIIYAAWILMFTIKSLAIEVLLFYREKNKL